MELLVGTTTPQRDNADLTLLTVPKSPKKV